MMASIRTGIILFVFSALVDSVYNLDYSDLEALGANCPEQDSCKRYKNYLPFTERNCECDVDCNVYNDCCIDAFRFRFRKRNTSRHEMRCMQYGESAHSGVYVIANCSSTWSGPEQIRQHCEELTDFKDPLMAAPVVSVSDGMAYHNRYCAECNDANMQNLQTFILKLKFRSVLPPLSEEQVLADLTYNRRQRSWGVNRFNSLGIASSFIGTDIFFKVPDYLKSSVRFCRSNIISKCSPNWTRQVIRKACEDYMAIVIDKEKEIAYRNPHCAICNYKTVGQVSCMNNLMSRKRPMSFALLLDINQSDGDQVGMRRVPTPECPSTHKWDPFFKRCRELVCALPGYVIQGKKCVKA